MWGLCIALNILHSMLNFMIIKPQNSKCVCFLLYQAVAAKAKDCTSALARTGGQALAEGNKIRRNKDRCEAKGCSLQVHCAVPATSDITERRAQEARNGTGLLPACGCWLRPSSLPLYCYLSTLEQVLCWQVEILWWKRKTVLMQLNYQPEKIIFLCHCMRYVNGEWISHLAYRLQCVNLW